MDTIKALKEIQDSCSESKQRNGVITYSVGGIESTQINYKQALQSVISDHQKKGKKDARYNNVSERK